MQTPGAGAAPAGTVPMRKVTVETPAAITSLKVRAKQPVPVNTGAAGLVGSRVMPVGRISVMRTVFSAPPEKLLTTIRKRTGAPGAAVSVGSAALDTVNWSATVTVEAASGLTTPASVRLTAPWAMVLVKVSGTPSVVSAP